MRFSDKESTSSLDTGLEFPEATQNRRLLLECPIAGLAYHDISDVWNELYVGAELALVREKHNKHDKNAVAVALAGDYDGNHDEFDFDFILGYVPKASNTTIATLLDMGWDQTLKAEIVGLLKNPKSYNAVKMAIYIVNQKSATDLREEDLPLFALSFEKEEWYAAHELLWKQGFLHFRWNLNAMDEERKYLREGTNVLLFHAPEKYALHHHEDSIQISMFRIEARDEDCDNVLGNNRYSTIKDSCTSFILRLIECNPMASKSILCFLPTLTELNAAPTFISDNSSRRRILQSFHYHNESLHIF